MRKATVRANAESPTRPDASLWVSANAGTGKTHVLIGRVARLLAEGAAPERILCLTYTKAAAAEMASRLSGMLGEWVLASDGDIANALTDLGVADIDAALIARARRLFARALEAPGGLKIQTIHAFCERLLKRFPLEAGLSPNFAVLDDLSAKDLLREAEERVLAEISTGARSDLAPALSRIARQSETALSDILSMLSRERAALARFFEAAEKAGGAEALICGALGIVPGETAADVRKAAIHAVPMEPIRRAAEALAHGGKEDCAHAQTLKAFISASDREGLFDAYLSVFFTQEGTARERLASKAAQASDPAIEALLREEQTRLERVTERLKACEAAADTLAALKLGGAVLDAYGGLKRMQTALDYDDLIACTAALLQRSEAAAWVLFKLDGGLDHILVDEAQDTSPEQWQVIKALAEEFFAGEGAREVRRTLFAVGDEKQSIFSFQGADPDAFERMRSHFRARAHAAGHAFGMPALEKSFRSVGPVLTLVDKVFADDALKWALSRSSPPLRHILTRIGEAGLVELWPAETAGVGKAPEPWDLPLDHVPSESPLARLARHVADLIARLLRGDRLHSEGRPIEPRDIMVLVRRRNALVDTLIRLLKDRQIPVAGSDRLVLTDHIAVMDLVAAGAFALLPEDDLTLATVLKSPLCALDEDELFEIAYGRTGTLWDALCEKSGRSPHIDFAIRLLRELRERADFDTPFAFYARLLGVHGGRQALVSRLGPEANDPIDEFLARALHYERLHPPSLQGFLHWLEAGSAEIKRDMEQGRDEVRVMTVHGAKGLEANVVILPDTCFAYRGPGPLFKGDRDILYWSARAVEAPAEVVRAREAAKARVAEEELRLLYVALTRARDRLYVCGYETKNGRPENCWHALVERALAEIGERFSPYDGATGYRLSSPQVSPCKPKEIGPRGIAKPESVPDWVLRTAPEPEGAARPRVLVPSRLGEEAEAPVLSPLVQAASPSQHSRGRLIHKLLEILPALPREARAAAARNFLARRALGLAADAQEEIARATLTVLDAEEYAPLFSPESLAEAAVVGTVQIEDCIYRVSGIVDRLALMADRVLVIDYKTNRPPPASLAEVPAAYVRQMALYRAVLAEAYANRSITCALLWTEGPALMTLPSEMLDRALRTLARLDGHGAAS